METIHWYLPDDCALDTVLIQLLREYIRKRGYTPSMCASILLELVKWLMTTYWREPKNERNV